MEQFIVKHQAKIVGMISCFDRILFKGYLPIGRPESMEAFLAGQGLLLKDFKRFATKCSQRRKEHAVRMAARAQRPFVYLNSAVYNKEEQAREVARRDGITQGLMCVFSITEACQSFKLKYGKGRPHLDFSKPRCLCLYFYYRDREFGLMHIRLQTWLKLHAEPALMAHSSAQRRAPAKAAARHG